MYVRHELGSDGEAEACEFLKKIGYKMVEKNYRCKIGEIDIVANEGDELVFVEVKTRSQKLFGDPAEAVNEQKRNHIYRVAEFYVMKNKLESEKMRFDVIEIYTQNGFKKVNLIKNAIIDKPKGCTKW